MTILQCLLGLVVKKVEKVHDYIQLEFSDGKVLSIFNNYICTEGSIFDIESSVVDFANESYDCVIIGFTGGKNLSISLNWDDFNGPEAMQLSQEGKTPIIWS